MPAALARSTAGLAFWSVILQYAAVKTGGCVCLRRQHRPSRVLKMVQEACPDGLNPGLPLRGDEEVRKVREVKSG